MSNSKQDRQELLKSLTRRYFFKQAGIGLGGTALSLLLRRDLLAAGNPPDAPGHISLGPKSPMFPA